jgi:hypothetical protein
VEKSAFLDLIIQRKIRFQAPANQFTIHPRSRINYPEAFQAAFSKPQIMSLTLSQLSAINLNDKAK